MVIIGITGGTGSGKTTVLRLFKKLGAYALDADEVYHDLLRGGGELTVAIAARFPNALVDGRIDTKRLGREVYNNPEALAELEKITHGFVLTEFEKRLQEANADGYVSAVIDAIALFESGSNRMCDAVIGVLAPAEIRISRIAARDNIDIQYAQMRINAQKKDEYYREHCDYILENSGEPAELEESAGILYNEILNRGENNGRKS